MVEAKSRTTDPEPAPASLDLTSDTKPEPRSADSPLTEFHIGMIGGALLGLSAGLLTTALIALAAKKAEQQLPSLSESPPMTK